MSCASCLAACAASVRPSLTATASAIASASVGFVIDTSFPPTRTRQNQDPDGNFLAVGVLKTFTPCLISHYITYSPLIQPFHKNKSKLKEKGGFRKLSTPSKILSVVLAISLMTTSVSAAEMNPSQTDVEVSDSIAITEHYIPLYFQTDYPDTRYGHGTVASSGCGVTSLAMVATYLTGSLHPPDSR